LNPRKEDAAEEGWGAADGAGQGVGNLHRKRAGAAAAVTSDDVQRAAASRNHSDTLRPLQGEGRAGKQGGSVGQTMALLTLLPADRASVGQAGREAWDTVT
jgi:hypothetical protein